MPTYEYACEACGHQWEQVQRIVEAPIEVCPQCAKSTAHRLISGGTHFILKGGGWYSDLYSSSKPPPKAGDSADSAHSKGEAAPAATASEGTKTDAKAETKAAPAPSPPPTAPSTPSSAPSSS